MENFKLGPYLIFAIILHLCTILIFGYIKEGEDINAASMYPVVYLLPTIVYCFFSGLLLFVIEPKKISKLLIILLLPALIAIGVIEIINTSGKGLYFMIVIASLIFNSGYNFFVKKNSNNTSTNNYVE